MSRCWFRTMAAVVLAVACRAEAEPQAPDPADELARIEAAVPADAEVVVTLHSGAAARRTPAGRAAAAMVTELVGEAETGRTWAGLAGVLGWSPEEAFDELLGRHVTLVVRGAKDGDGAWGLMGMVSREAEDRLRSKLNPVPREVVGGTTVLSIESGKYRMAICTREGGASSTYALAPAGAAGLLDELIHRLAAGPTGAPKPLPARGCVAVVIRRPPAVAGPPFCLTLTAALDAPATGMDVRMECAGVSDPGLDAVTPWSDAAIRALSDGAFLATMGVVGLSPFQSAADIIGIPRVDLAPAGMDQLLGQRVALIVREAPSGQLAPAPPSRMVQAAGDGFEGVLTAAGAARRPLSITLAIETLDLARSIPRADALAVRFTQPELGAGVELAAFDDGAGATRVRALPLTGPAVQDWAPVAGDEPVLRWAFARDVAARGAGSERGWWIVGLTPAGPAARGVESVRAALLRSGADASDLRRISAGFVRPRAIERWAVSVDPRFAPFVRALRRVESVRWDAWLGDDGGIEGRATVRWDVPGR